MVSAPQTRPAKKLLIAASGTGGHLFPALATAEHLTDYTIEWLGVPDRLENQMVPDRYPLHKIQVEGFQKGFGLSTFKVLWQFGQAILQVRRLLKRGQFQGVFTTGGYIAAPAILAARSLGLPTILHESNAIPGKVTRFLSPWCSQVAVGFAVAAKQLPPSTVYVGTPVRSQFLQSVAQSTFSELEIPPEVPLIVVVGGSQGALAVNRLVRQCAAAWLESGAWIVHLTGESDPEAQSFQHPHYIALPFFHNMAGLFKRANLAISRAGAGTLTELAITGTPALLIPYPYAAEDHQTHNAATFATVGAAEVYQQKDLTPGLLESKVLSWLRSPDLLAQMSAKMAGLAIPDSAEQMATLIRQQLEP